MKLTPLTILYRMLNMQLSLVNFLSHALFWLSFFFCLASAQHETTVISNLENQQHKQKQILFNQTFSLLDRTKEPVSSQETHNNQRPSLQEVHLKLLVPSVNYQIGCHQGTSQF